MIDFKQCSTMSSRIILEECAVRFEQAPESVSNRLMQIMSAKVLKHLPHSWRVFSSPEEVKRWLLQQFKECTLLAISLRSTREIIGLLFVHEEKDDGSPGRCHIGYLLGESYWGKGYAKECLNTLIESLLHSGYRGEIFAGVEESNIASIRLLEKVGFSRVRLKDKDASQLFYVYYS